MDCDADAGSVLSRVSPVSGLVVRPFDVNASPDMILKKRRPVRELSVASRMATNWFMSSGMLQKIMRSATRSGPLKHFFSMHLSCFSHPEGLKKSRKHWTKFTTAMS